MQTGKQYLDVITLIREDGTLRPLFICWNHQRYRIDKVLSIREIYSKAGGCGICYTCRMGEHRHNLFWERNRWFIELESY